MVDTATSSSRFECKASFLPSAIVHRRLWCVDFGCVWDLAQVSWSASCNLQQSTCSSLRPMHPDCCCQASGDIAWCLLCQESSGHRVFEIKRQLIADVAANSELECRKTLLWAGKDAEAVRFVTVQQVLLFPRPLSGQAL